MGTVRFLLALAVALNHAGGVFGYYMMSGALAVQAFYVISGFLITHILLTKYEETAQGNWLFYSNRALRIYVPYWTVLIGTAVVAGFIYLQYGSIAGPVRQLYQFWSSLTLAAKAFVAFCNVFILGQDVSLWLKLDPANGSFHFALDALARTPLVNNFNVLTPAWTIALELMFYMIAPFIVRRHVLVVAGLVVASFALRFVAYDHGFYSSATAYRFFPFELGLFLMGTVSYRLYQFVKPWLSLRASAAIVIVTVGIILNHHEITQLAGSRLPGLHAYYFYAMLALVMPALFDFARRFPRDRWVGELSYPIYLIHWPVQWTMMGPNFSAPVSICITLLLSVALVVLVTAPLDKWRDKRAKSLSTVGALDHSELQDQRLGESAVRVVQ